ncbi:MAG: hypothetical protein IPO83_00075 [Chitinophagaceae bacterium]|nr:hypothetical protein [Chitinophagaceae bacterium]
MKKKKDKIDEAQVDPELKGLDIRVNEFGEIISNISPDKLNDFLDRKVVDKKLVEKKEKEQKKPGQLKK